MEHKHAVTDRDPHFTIDPATRMIVNKSPTKTALMQYDHNSERFSFDLPRYIDDHDMSGCNRVEIHYINIGTNNKRTSDVYLAKDLSVSPDDNQLVTFSWLVSQNATQHEGSLSFVIRFICDTEGSSNYIWSTAVYSGISIGRGIDNAEAIVTQYSDVLGAWYSELFGKVYEAGINKAKEVMYDEILTTMMNVGYDEIMNGVLDRMQQAEEVSF